MGTFSIWHWLVVLVIVVLVFGTKKLRNLGSDLGSAVRGFKEGMKSADDDASSAKPTTPPASQPISSLSVEHEIKDNHQTKV